MKWSGVAAAGLLTLALLPAVARSPAPDVPPRKVLVGTSVQGFYGVYAGVNRSRSQPACAAARARIMNRAAVHRALIATPT